MRNALATLPSSFRRGLIVARRRGYCASWNKSRFLPAVVRRLTSFVRPARSMDGNSCKEPCRSRCFSRSLPKRRPVCDGTCNELWHRSRPHVWGWSGKVSSWRCNRWVLLKHRRSQRSECSCARGRATEWDCCSGGFLCSRASGFWRLLNGVTILAKCCSESEKIAARARVCSSIIALLVGSWTYVPGFYQRLGGMIAAAYLLKAVDCHRENVIAVGEYPILVDVDALWHVSPLTRTQSLATVLYRTGFLPNSRPGSLQSRSSVLGR